MSESAPALPLEGIRVIDAGQVIAGPLIGQMLGDFGAEVIKIEDPRGGDYSRSFRPYKGDHPLFWKDISRSKKAITLNLSDPRGVDIYKQLVAEADVAIQSFRPPTLKRYRIDYDSLSAINPRLILVLLSGFGQTGPYRDRPGYGTLAEAMSGFAHMTGQADGPPTLPSFALADMVAGVYGYSGVLNALYWRDAQGGGRGQCIDLDLLTPLINILGPRITYFDQLGIVPKRQGNHITANAPRNLYRTKDERWVAIAATGPSIVKRFFEVIGRPELLQDPKFATAVARVANMEEVDAVVTDWTTRHTLDEIMVILVEAEVTAAPVWDVSDHAADEHLAHIGAIATIEDPDLGPMKFNGVLPRMSRTPGRIAHTGMAMGACNEEVYGSLGITGDRLAELKAEGVI